MKPSESPAAGMPTGDLAVLTLVLWASVLAVGALGMFLRYELPGKPVATMPPVVVERLSVEVGTERPVRTDRIPPAPVPEPPPLARPVDLPPVIPPMVVAVALPAVASGFQVPLARPDVAPATAPGTSPGTIAGPDAVVVPAPAPVTRLVFGEGEGRQPAPEYPVAALRRGQEGTVGVRLSVAKDGTVRSAEVSAQSPWPLLDRAAVDAVRVRWRFPSGTARLYEVSIRFEIQK